MTHAIFKMIQVLDAENFFVKTRYTVFLSCRHLKSGDLKSLAQGTLCNLHFKKTSICTKCHVIDSC